MEQVHLDYLEAGADIITSASYQVLSLCLSLLILIFLLAKTWDW